MALFKILRGPSNSIQDEKKVPLRDGYAYFTPDKGNFYIDARTDESNAASVKRIWINPPVAEFDSSEWGKAANDRISIVDKYINYIKPPVVDPANHRMTIYDGEGVAKNVWMDFVSRNGDTMKGDLSFSNITTGVRQIQFTVGNNDYARLAGGATDSNAGYLELATADGGNEPIYVRQYTGVFGTATRTLTLLDASGNTSIPGSLTAAKDITAPKFHGTVDYATYDVTEKGKGTSAVDIASKYISYIKPPVVDAPNHNIMIYDGNGLSRNVAANFVNRNGDTLGGGAYFRWPDSGNFYKTGVTFPVNRGGVSWTGQSDGIDIHAEETSQDNLELVVKFTDDNSNGMTIRNASNAQTIRMKGSGEITTTSTINAGGDITAPKFHGIADYATYDTTERGKTNKQDIANKYIHTIATKVDTANKKLISTYGDGTTAQIDLENLEQIGGRNLLRNSAITKENLKYWIADSATKSIENVDGENCLKIVSTGNGGVYGDMNAGINNLYPGKIYTYSFWIKSNVAKPFNRFSIGHYQTVISGNAHVSTNRSFYPDTIPANTWTKAICKFTVSSQCRFVPYIWYLGNGTTVWVKDIKLEEGNEATDWTPAPEDLAYLNSSPTFTGDLKAASLTADDSLLVHGNATFKSNINADGTITAPIIYGTHQVKIAKNGSAGYGLTNSDGASIIRDHGNGNTTVDATGGELFLAYEHTNRANFFSNKVYVNNNGSIDMTGKLNSTYANSIAISNQNLISSTPTIEDNTDRTVGQNTLRNFIGWQDLEQSLGYRTLYRIGSQRTKDSWGRMYLAVGNSDNSHSSKLELSGNGWSAFTGRLGIGVIPVAPYQLDVNGQTRLRNPGAASNSPLVVGGMAANINTDVTGRYTTTLQIVAGDGGATNGTGIAFHNPLHSSASFGYYNTDTNNGHFEFNSDDTAWDINVNNHSIVNLPTGGGIYWNPHVESASDASDAASITQIKSGVAGGTELRIQQQSDSNDVINLVVPDYIYLNGKRAFTINDSWLRINQDLGFSSGIYTGSSVIRSDNELQVGGSGNKFYANSSGDGYFSNTLGIAGKNTNYNLYVNGTSRFNNTLYFFNSIGDTALSIESRRSKNSSNANLETNTGLVTKDKSFIEIRGFAPPTMVRTTGEKPAPYGLGFGNGKESAGIMPIGEGDNLKELMFYGANSGPTLFTWKYQVWEATDHDSDSSNAYSDAAMSLTSKTGDLYVKNTIGIKGQNTGYNLYVNGTSLTTGAATFNGGVTFTHKNFNYSGMENGTLGTYRHVWFSDSGTRGKPVYSNGIMYNPTAGLKVTNWVRTTGATGWYSETYGGGWYMSDSTYIRSYNGKSTRLDNLCLGADNNSYRLYVNGTSYFTNYLQTTSYFKSTVADGTSPIQVNSTTLNTHLNADLLDGYHETAFPRLVGRKNGTWNWNDMSRAGYYKIQAGTITNHPSDVYNYGMAEVLTTENHGDGENRILQIYYPYSRRKNNSPMYLRMHNGNDLTSDGQWTSWCEVASTDSNVASATIASSLRDRTNNNVTYSNYGASDLAGSAISWMTCWNGYELRAISKAETFNVVRDNGGDARWVRKSGDTMTGDLTAPNLSANQYLRANAYPEYGTGWGGFWYDGGNKNLCAYGDTGRNITFQASKVYGAVWNDYAEYRKTDEIKAGQCVIETGKGDLVQSTARLQPGANIVSDTFGFAIGETENTKTPIAVSGRVLAYPYEDRDSYQAGDPVCSGPNGTISKMTREEVREYPDRIVGTVSEIPDYEVWGTGKVKVNGRIWIKVK